MNDEYETAEEELRNRRTQDSIADLLAKKESEGLTDLEEKFLKTVQGFLDFKDEEADKKIQDIIKESREAGEDFFPSEKEGE